MKERVNKGAALLDEKHPGWREKINIDKFDIDHCNFCVLCQLYGSYFNGLNQLNITGDATGHGFCPTDKDEIKALNDMWIEEIKVDIL